MLTTAGRSHNPNVHALSCRVGHSGFRRLPGVTVPEPSAGPGGDRGLRLAACLVAAEGAALLVVAGAALFSLSGSRVGFGLTTALFFAACGLGLGWAARGLWQAQSWSRGPVVVAQLLTAGIAWSTRSVPWVAVLLALWALAVLFLVLRPAANEALSE